MSVPEVKENMKKFRMVRDDGKREQVRDDAITRFGAILWFSNRSDAIPALKELLKTIHDKTGFVAEIAEFET